MLGGDTVHPPTDTETTPNLARFREALSAECDNPNQVVESFFHIPLVHQVLEILVTTACASIEREYDAGPDIEWAVEAYTDMLVFAHERGSHACVGEVLEFFNAFWECVLSLCSGRGLLNLGMLVATESALVQAGAVGATYTEMHRFCRKIAERLNAVMSVPRGREAGMLKGHFLLVCFLALAHSANSPELSHALPLHTLVDNLFALFQQDIYKSKFTDDLAGFEDANPGSLLCFFLRGSRSLFDAPPRHRSWSTTLSAYFAFSKHMCASETVFNKFRTTRGIRFVVDLLARAFEGSPMSVSASDCHNLIVFWMPHLTPLTVHGNSNKSTLDAIRIGVLPILATIVAGDRNARPGSSDLIKYRQYRGYFNTYLLDALIPALVWPDTLLAIRKMGGKLHPERWDISYMLDYWPEYVGFTFRDIKYYRILKRTKKWVRKVTERCHNPKCPRPVNAYHAKICACVQVAYCSKPCQRAHWQDHHRVECTRGLNARESRNVLSESAALCPLETTYFERYFIRQCIGDPTITPQPPPLASEEHGHRRSWLLDLSVRPASMDPTWIQFDDPLPAVENHIRRYVRVRKGATTGLILV
ncbi:uncharacterized protein SCHCODRAFT_02707015 [Schizophyllum commune H4-8]|nr:uncharacterized protein SCHCODRAFT_02707015 [Schizophyllum commune H4-8]KAI5885085.1 hypothetical protein SCHCODRAFT_02707015 [Schizophyllum commune H4-8]